MFAAIGFVLDELQGILSKGLFINGGSIGFAMIAVLVIGYRRGWLPALLTGLIMGLFDVATSAYIIHPAQLFLDYILPYAFVAVGCLCKFPFDKAKSKGMKIMWLIIGTIVGGLAKFVSHYLAGIFFWADPNNFAWNLNALSPYLYCFIYNIAFIGPSIVLSAAILSVMYITAPKIFTPNGLIIEEKDRDYRSLKIATVSVIGTGGLFCFIWYLIDYIKSFSDYTDDGAYGYDFNPDSMVLFVLGLFIVILCVLSIIRIFKTKFSPLLFSSLLSGIFGMSLIYGIARLIRMYVKEKDPKLYWIWFGIGLTTLLLSLVAVVIFAIKRSNEKKQLTNGANQ